jgi:prepilin-type N-terminal cleavage/methylation domain-containing protein
MHRKNSTTSMLIPSNLDSNYQQHKSRGLTMIEMVAAVAIFALLMTGVIGIYDMLVRGVKVAREKTVLANIASSYSEIVRNLPFSQIGTLNGNPSGTLADSSNPVVTVIEGITYNIYYEVTWIDDPSDGTILAGTDPAPDDYKQVKMTVKNMSNTTSSTFVTSVVPKGLEGTINAGALLIKVINSQGQPVSGASVHIENLALSPDILLDRTTDAGGNWVEVGLPPSVTSYHVVVTKNGYSSDQTYPSTAGNPNPTKPDATIANAQVTQISFAIDVVSNLAIKTLNSVCGNLNGVNINIASSKLIGTNPNVVKLNSNYSSSGGQVALNNTEWDTYVPTLLNGQSLMIIGTSPIQQISVLPGSSATYTMILGTQTTNSFLVIVKDSASGTALENAHVNLHKGGSTPQDYDGYTGGSIWIQKDWTGGSGQTDFTNPARYASDDGNINLTGTPSGVRLAQAAGSYVASGELTSSTFDTGGASNYTTLSWQPTSQNPSTTLKFQIASNNDNSTWNYKGPDGTGSTYYTVSGSSIAAIHDNDRYVRYKAFLSTTDNNQTPVLSNIGINYVSGCFTPGQVSFPGLTAGNNYDLTVSLAGYQDVVLNSLNISGNQLIQVQMNP